MLTRCTLTILSLNLNVWNHPSWAKFCQVSLTYKVRLYRVKEDKSIPSTGWCLFSKQNILRCYFPLNPPFFPPHHTTSNLFVQVLNWDTFSSGRIDPNTKPQKMLIKFPLDSDWCKHGGWVIQIYPTRHRRSLQVRASFPKYKAQPRENPLSISLLLPVLMFPKMQQLSLNMNETTKRITEMPALKASTQWTISRSYLTPDYLSPN